MEGQTLMFNTNPYRTPPIPLYESYHTPPYTFNSSPWSQEYLYHHPLSMCEDVIQIQHQQLRFPTPPITPPRSIHSAAEPQEEVQHQQVREDLHQSHNKEDENHLSGVPLRTKSVIMKIGHDQSPHHLSTDFGSYITSHQLNSEDNGETLLSSHQQHHLHQHFDTPSSGTSSPSSNNDFVCDWIDCGRYFESLELLAIHVTQIHAVASLTDGLYYCRWSGCQRTERGFNARYKMLVHVRTHTKEKPHQCHLCDKRFSRAENLKIHIRSHSGEKPYICTFEGCNKAYSNSSDRFKHTRTHSMEKPYLCKVPGCQKRYTDPSSLRKHVKTFKHSIQIMDSGAPKQTTATTPPPYQTHNQYHNQDESRSFSPSEQSDHGVYPSYHHLIMAARPTVSVNTPDPFCMAMEEMCHIRATLDSYKCSATPSDTDNYWLHEGADSNYNTSITMDLSSEKPLDLRVKRC